MRVTFRRAAIAAASVLSLAIPAVLATPAGAVAPPKNFPDECGAALKGGIDPAGGSLPTGLIPTLGPGAYANVSPVKAPGVNPASIVSDLSNTSNGAFRFKLNLTLAKAPAATAANGGTQPADATGLVSVLWKNGPGTTPANTGVGLPTLSIGEHSAIFGTPPTVFFAKGTAYGVPGPIWQADPLVSPPNSPLKNVINDTDLTTLNPFLLNVADVGILVPGAVLNPLVNPLGHLHSYGLSWVLGNANQVATNQAVLEMFPAVVATGMGPIFAGTIAAATGQPADQGPCSTGGLIHLICLSDPTLLPPAFSPVCALNYNA